MCADCKDAAEIEAMHKPMTQREQIAGWVNRETGESVTYMIDMDAAVATMSAEELRGYVAAQQVIASRLRATVATLTEQLREARERADTFDAACVKALDARDAALAELATLREQADTIPPPKRRATRRSK